MPLYEVKVQVSTTRYYLVEAKDAGYAEGNYPEGVENGEFVEMEEVIDVYLYDDRFEDDSGDMLSDVYEIEQEDTDE